VIPKSQKLISHTEITQAARTRFKFSSQFYTLFVAKNVTGTSRILVTVSKKIAKSAVTRNRIRRKIHAVLFDKLSKIPQQYNYLIQVTNKEILRCSYLQLFTLISHIEQASVTVDTKLSRKNNSSSKFFPKKHQSSKRPFKQKHTPR